MIAVLQINQPQLTLFVQQATSGSAFSGNFVSLVSNGVYMGPNVVATTGGAQTITGLKTFDSSPNVPYSGTTGSAPSARWVNDQIAAIGSSSSTAINSLSGYVQGASGALSYVRVTGSSTIGGANFTGLGGTLIIYSGNLIFISGAAGGGGAGSSNVQITGSSTLSTANFTGAGSVTLFYDGTKIFISGTAGADSTLSGYVEGNFVHRGAVDELVSGIKTFTGSPQVPSPALPSGAANLSWVSGVSGDLYARMTGISGAVAGTTTNYYITGTGVVTASATGIVTNTFNVTSGNISLSSSGTVTNNFNSPINYNINQPTGNFVNMSFYYDENNLATGLNTYEAFIGRSFIFTGYALGVINTGTQGFFSGSFYQRTATNGKTNFTDFSLNSGALFYASGGFNQTISGLNRVGLDIYRIGTGITGLSVGLFGVGY